jgi:hypothetical protein
MRVQIERQQKEIDEHRMSHREYLEKLKATETISLLMENYKKIRDQNCDLTLEVAGGKKIEVHKTILMGKYLLLIHPTYLITNQLFPRFSSAQFKIR